MIEKRRVSSTSKARAPADTNATARRGSIGSGLLTATGQWHEAYWKQLPSCPPPVVRVTLHQHEVLTREWRTDRDHHAALGFQLADQRRRDLARRGGHDDAVKGRRLLPAVIAIARACHDIAIAQPLQPRGSAVRQPRHDLDRVNPPREMGEDCCLVARAGAHLKDGIVRPDVNQVGHESDDERLRNGLTIADQRPSNVCIAYNPAGCPASRTKRARCRQPIHAAGAARSPSAAARSNCSPHPPTAAARRSCSRTGSRSISWWISSAPAWRLHGPSAWSQADARWKSSA